MNVTTNDPDFIRRRNRSRLQLLLLALVFMGPVALAFMMYYGGIWVPQTSVEHGQLIEPARQLPDSILGVDAESDDPLFLGHWTLLILAPGDCPKPCREALYETRQLRRALGRDMDRVARVWLVTDSAADPAFLAAEHPQLVVVSADHPAQANLTALIGERQAGQVFVVDPLGRMMMRFPSGLGMRDMHTDLKRLLKISQIG